MVSDQILELYLSVVSKILIQNELRFHTDRHVHSENAQNQQRNVSSCHEKALSMFFGLQSSQWKPRLTVWICRSLLVVVHMLSLQCVGII